MHAFLEVVSGAKVGQRILVKDGESVLGRSKDAVIRIPSSRVSRKHCTFTWRKNQLLVQDLGSMNGTLLNGVTIQKQTLLRENDQITVGPVVFKVVIPTMTVAPPVKAVPPPISAVDDSFNLDVLEEPKTTGDVALDDDIFGVLDNESQNTQKPKPRKSKTEVGSNEFKEVNSEVIPPLSNDAELSLHLSEGKDLRDILSQLDSFHDE